MLGVHIDDNLPGTRSFSTCFQKEIAIPLALVSDKILPFFTSQGVILQCLY